LQAKIVQAKSSDTIFLHQQKAVPAESKSATQPYVTQYRNRGELLMAIDNYRNREIQLSQEIKKERFAMQLLQIEGDSLNHRIRQVEMEIDLLNAKIDAKSRGKDSNSSIQTGTATKPKTPIDTTVKTNR
jgi:hypothetical protein